MKLFKWLATVVPAPAVATAALRRQIQGMIFGAVRGQASLRDGGDRHGKKR